MSCKESFLHNNGGTRDSLVYDQDAFAHFERNEHVTGTNVGLGWGPEQQGEIGFIQHGRCGSNKNVGCNEA
jgi:hypothetical protein